MEAKQLLNDVHEMLVKVADRNGDGKLDKSDLALAIGAARKAAETAETKYPLGTLLVFGALLFGIGYCLARALCGCG